MLLRTAQVADDATWRARFRRDQLGRRMQPIAALTGRSFSTTPAPREPSSQRKLFSSLDEPSSREVESTTFTFREAFAGNRSYRGSGRSLRVAGVYVELVVSTTYPHQRLKLVQAARRFEPRNGGYESVFVGMHAVRATRAGLHDPGAPHRGWFIDVEAHDSAYWDDYRYAGRAGSDGRPAVLLDSPGVGDAPGGYEFWTCAVSEWEGRRRIIGALWWGFEVDVVRRYWFFRSHRTSVYEPAARELPPPAFFAAAERWDGEPLALDV